MLHLYSGEDDFRIREAYRRLRASLGDDEMLAANTTELDPRSLAAAELIQHAATVPFLAEARVVVVEGLLRTLGGGRGVLERWQPLLDFVPQMPPSNHLVLLEPAPRDPRDASRGSARSRLASALREIPGADVQQFPRLSTRGRDGNQVAAWVRERASERAVHFDPPAITELVELIGANLHALASEIDKLGTYAGGRAVTVEDVQLLTPEAQEGNIFALVDAVVEGRAAPALRLMRKMTTEGTHSPGRIQAMIARQLRNLVRATELLEARASPQAIGEATGVTARYPLQLLTRQARASTRAAVEAGLREVERSDNAVKTGRLEEELALELLITRLAALTLRPAAASRAAR